MHRSLPVASLVLSLLALTAGSAPAQLLGDTIHADYRHIDGSINFFDPAESPYVPFGANPLQPSAIVSEDDTDYVEFTAYTQDAVTQAEFIYTVDVDDRFIRIDFYRGAPGGTIPWQMVISDLGDGTALDNMVVVHQSIPCEITHDATSITLVSPVAHGVSSGTTSILISLDGITDAPEAGRALLEQNFPNPFNPATVIPFRLGDAGPVKLEVFDVRGQRIRTLTDRHFDAGRHEIRWDGTDGHGSRVNSGIYLYRLTTREGVLSNKMSLVQ